MPAEPRGHEALEHTADVGLHIWAPTLAELFSEAAVALVGVMGAPSSSEPSSAPVDLEATDLDALFVDWLSEVLYLFEARALVPIQARVRIGDDPWRVDGVIHGVSSDGFEQHGPAVKAVTFHGLQITRSPDVCEAQVYLDV